MRAPERGGPAQPSAFGPTEEARLGTAATTGAPGDEVRTPTILGIFAAGVAVRVLAACSPAFGADEHDRRRRAGQRAADAEQVHPQGAILDSLRVPCALTSGRRSC